MTGHTENFVVLGRQMDSPSTNAYTSKATTIAEQLVILQAIVDGKKIEYRDNTGRRPGWHPYYTDAKARALDFMAFTFRVKPQPRELWVVYWPNGTASTFHTRVDADTCCLHSDALKPVKFVEVLE